MADDPRPTPQEIDKAEELMDGVMFVSVFYGTAADERRTRFYTMARPPDNAPAPIEPTLPSAEDEGDPA